VTGGFPISMNWEVLLTILNQLIPLLIQQLFLILSPSVHQFFSPSIIGVRVRTPRTQTVHGPSISALGSWTTAIRQTATMCVVLPDRRLFDTLGIWD